MNEEHNPLSSAISDALSTAAEAWQSPCGHCANCRAGKFIDDVLARYREASPSWQIMTVAMLDRPDGNIFVAVMLLRREPSYGAALEQTIISGDDD